MQTWFNKIANAKVIFSTEEWFFGINYTGSSFLWEGREFSSKTLKNNLNKTIASKIR